VTEDCKPLYKAWGGTSLIPVYLPKCKKECTDKKKKKKYVEDLYEGKGG
jgi:hypothetical protein